MTIEEFHKMADQARADKIEKAKLEAEAASKPADLGTDDADLLGTDKSEGATKAEGADGSQEKEPAKDDAGKTLTATLEMEVPKTGEQTTVLGTAETHEVEKGTKDPAADKNEPAAPAAAFTGV
jgi:hypothetical protein